ncbi:hypothetical protein J3U11_11255 [Gilliamella sp. B2840]|uniref:phage tail tube protein n=1 Tax=unclassified Gilliamella TaxID=2685620 RepID=UPI00226A3510|nr:MULTISPECIES: phage tail tube protein [unclassified Gilliamella]MCX8665982.1 hypothetical protein [Gilliamella sp. B2887]MCX8696561.1 hypothetical protein [Gilliamella sp. B2828]MCX8698306.1 hypothetical protein [Gilliamella sp. B3000]MCX8701651.1 hypothetical protein [Gilliamella sp. B2840]
MGCEKHKIDSNITGLFIAEEECLKSLSASPIWRGIEPNSYSDLGGSLTQVKRETINPSRQSKKGVIVDMDATAGFTVDMTKNIFSWLMQGFMFADAREKTSTSPISGETIKITDVDTTTYNLETSLKKAPLIGSLIYASGFNSLANNGVKTVTESTPVSITVSGSLVSELKPPSNSCIHVVGMKFGVGECNFILNAGERPKLIITSDSIKFTDLGLTLGERIFIGGDGTNARFKNNVGYARIESISDAELMFDDTTFTPVSEIGDGISLEIYFGSVIRNESEQEKIITRSYCIERTLGADDKGIQAQYVNGAVANELTLNCSTASLVTADMSYIACSTTNKKGGERLAGMRLPLDATDAFNTSSNIYLQKLSIIDGQNTNPKPLFGYVTEATISISNNVSGLKALSILGSFDVSVGNFDVSGSLTAMFSTVDAIEAIKNNADVGLLSIFAAKNTGIIFDIPLLSLGGGMLNVEKDQAITIPLEQTGAENKHGYTLMYQQFNYLPDIAMPLN